MSHISQSKKDYCFHNHYKGHWNWVLIVLLMQWSVELGVNSFTDAMECSLHTQHLDQIALLYTIYIEREGCPQFMGGNKICIHVRLVAGGRGRGNCPWTV